MQPNTELIEYIKQQRSLGEGDLDITNTLINAGWQEATIRAAFAGTGAAPSFNSMADQDAKKHRRRKQLATVSIAITLIILALVGYLAIRTLSTPPIS